MITLAEVRLLEIERLREECAKWEREYMALRAELRAENQQLRDALQQAWDVIGDARLALADKRVALVMDAMPAVRVEEA